MLNWNLARTIRYFSLAWLAPWAEFAKRHAASYGAVVWKEALELVRRAVDSVSG